jgi:hypothetical protein
MSVSTSKLVKRSIRGQNYKLTLFAARLIVWGMHRMRASLAENGMRRDLSRSSKKRIIVSLFEALSETIVETYITSAPRTVRVQNTYLVCNVVRLQNTPNNLSKVFTRMFAGELAKVDQYFLYAAI